MKAPRVQDYWSKQATSSSSAVPGNAYCSCLGTLHKVVSNCTSCGYILCEKSLSLAQSLPHIMPLNTESIVKDPEMIFQGEKALCICPFCGSQCYQVPSAKDLGNRPNIDRKTIEAYALKEKLLLFDREHEQRTTVRDAQGAIHNSCTLMDVLFVYSGDYYTNTTWLSEEEKVAAERAEAIRTTKMEARRRGSRGRRKYTIRFDIAGRKLVEVEPDPEEEHEEERESVQAYENAVLEQAESRAGEVYRFIQER
jgi:hypothetical protein